MDCEPTTGFKRPNRSFYADDIKLAEGATCLVRCKCNMDMFAFTAGKVYTMWCLKGVNRVQCDDGSWRVASARFTLLQDDPHDGVLHEWASNLHKVICTAAAYGSLECFKIGDPCDDWSEHVT